VRHSGLRDGIFRAYTMLCSGLWSSCISIVWMGRFWNRRLDGRMGGWMDRLSYMYVLGSAGWGGYLHMGRLIKYLCSSKQ
jgi:hypothetical protein